MNRRIIHVVCGGINTGKTAFSRYLQIGKKNVFRLCKEELMFSIGIGEHTNQIMMLASLFIKLGDVVLDDISYNQSVFYYIQI